MITNIPYNPQTDPKAMFAQGFSNMLGGAQQGLDRRRIAKFAETLGADDTAIQILSKGLKSGIDPQTAMAIGALKQKEGQYGAGRLGTVPGWWAYATPKQKQDYMNRVGGPLVQVGPKRWTEGQLDEAAQVDYQKKVGLSSSDLNLARQSVKTIISEMEHGTWAGDMKGFKNYKRDNLVAAYNQYRNENNYSGKSAKNRERLDNLFDSQMQTYNKGGYKDHGKNEFDWNPEDARVQALRTEKAESTVEATEPKTQDEFKNTLRRLQMEDYKKATEYYNKYLDRFY